MFSYEKKTVIYMWVSEFSQQEEDEHTIALYRLPT